AAATLLVAPAGSAATNAFPAGTLVATGWTNLVARGLRPATSYAGVLRLDSGLAGGVRDLPVAFETAPESNDLPPVSACAWTNTGTWRTDEPPFETNLLRAATYAVSGTKWTGSTAYLSDGAFVTQSRGCGLGSGNTVTWTLAEPSDVSRIRAYAYWPDSNWMKIAIESVSFQDEAGAWTTLESSGTVHSIGDTTQSAELSATEPGKVLFPRATGIRILFRANPSRDGTIYHEFEAFAPEADQLPPDLAVLSATRTAERLAAVVGLSHPLATNAVATAYLAAVYGAEDTNAWTAAATAPLERGAVAQSFSIPAAELAGMSYLRFRYADESGVSRWTDSVYLPDLPVLESVPPAVAFSHVAGATADTATIAAILAEAGTGAAGGAADVYLQYSLVPGAFDGLEGAWTGSERLLASGVPAGATNLVATWLRPGRNYTARLVARNAAGDEGVSESFDFSTPVERDFTGGEWGLRQVQFFDCSAFATRDFPAVPADADVVEGVIMADTSRYATSSRTGVQYDWGDQQKNLGFAYAGAIFLEAGQTYTFGENFDDGVRIEIDGEAVLDNRDYTKASYADYACTRTGWHSFKLWLFQDYGGVGWRTDRLGGHSVAWNTAGVKATGSNSAWRDFIDPGDGSLLWSVFPRAPVVEGFAKDGDALVLTVSLPAADGPCSLYAVWGEANAGADTNAWFRRALVSGDVAAGATNLAYRIADAAEAAVVRFYTEDAAGNVAWSESCYPDFATPVVRDGGVSHDGDRATLTANLLSAGVGELVLVVQWADNAAMAGARSQAIATAGPGVYSATIEVEPGATTWYRFVAQIREGPADVTPVSSFTTLAGSRLASTASCSSVSHHTATLNGSLAAIGAGETEIWVYAGTDPQALEPFDVRTVSAAGAFTLSETFPGDPHQVWFAFKSVNVAAGGTRWESWSSTNSLTTVDALTYTWRQDVSEGAWNNPSNWIPSASADDCIGYPDHRNASVDFANGTVATVTVPGKFRFGGWPVYRNDLDLTFVGDGAAVSGLTGDMQGGSTGYYRNCSWTFSNLTLTEDNGITFGDTGSRDSTIRATDGAVVSFGDATTLMGSNMWIVVDGGATLESRKNGPALAMKDGGIRIEDGILTGGRILTDYNWAQTTNQTILVSGAAPRIVLSTSFRNADEDSNKPGANLQNADTAFLFTVPKEGWAEPAISSESATEAFGALRGDGAGRYVLSLDPKSPAFKRAGDHAVQLLAWAGGVDTNHVALAPAPENAEVFWTYGWPSVRTAPASAGDAPTGVRAVIHGANLSIPEVRSAADGVVATVSLDALDEDAENVLVSIEVSSSPDGFADPDFAFAYAGNPVAEPGEFDILATNLVPATPYWARAVVVAAGGGEPSHSEVRPLVTEGEGRYAFVGAAERSLSAQATLVAAGVGSAGAKVRIEASLTADFAALYSASREVRVEDGSSATLAVEDLDPETSYWLRARFTTDRGFVFYGTDTVARATTADPIDRAIVFVPGLVQARLSGGANWTTDVKTHSSAVYVPGAIMASTTQKALNPYDGKEYSWGGDQTWGYVGQMWMEGGRTYWFAKQIDDRAWAKVEDSVIFGSSSTGSFAPPGSGWYDVDFRVGNDGGAAGNTAGSIGFGWNADGIWSFETATFRESGGWHKAIDPGDGSMLRVVYSETPFMTVESVSSAGGVLAVTASFDGVPENGGEFRAFFGPANCGVDEAAWPASAVVAQIWEGDTASRTYAVPGAGNAAFVVFRFSGKDPANAPWRQWSPVYDLAAERPSFRIESSLVAFTNLSWIARCTGVGQGASTVSAEIQLSTEADFSVTNQVVPFGYDGVGVFEASFAGLETNKTYWARVTGVNDRGERGFSTTISRTTLLPGPPVTTLVPMSVGFSSVDWQATVNAFGFGGESARFWIDVSESGDFGDAVSFGDFLATEEPFAISAQTPGLKPGTTYAARSHARNVWGVEAVSAPCEFTTRAEPFVMTDVGSVAGAAGRTTLTIECVQLEPGTRYYVTFNVDGSTIGSSYGTSTGVFSAIHFGVPGSTHSVVVTVAGSLDGAGRSYVRTYSGTFTVGENAYAIGSLADLRSVPMHVGDKLLLPELATARDYYVPLDIRPFELLEDGRTIRAVAPGFSAVAAYRYDPLQDAEVRDPAMGLAVCVPEAPGRVFVAKETTGSWNWSDTKKWTCVSDPSATGAAYPDGVGDVAMAPLARNTTLTLDVDATVGALYVGFDAAVPPSGSLRFGGNNRTLTFRSGEKNKPGLLRVTGLGRSDVYDDRPSFTLGSDSAGKRLVLAVPEGLDIDGGKHPDYTNTVYRNRHNYLRFWNGYGDMEIPAGKVLHLDNFDHCSFSDSQMGNCSAFIWQSGFPIAGEGTIVYDSAALGYFNGALKDFAGTLVIRQKQRYAGMGVDSRGGGFWLVAGVGKASKRSTFRIEGEVPYSDSLRNAIGLATWGSTHGWGAWGPGDNCFGGRAMVFAGGTLLQRGNDGSWPNAGIYKNPNRSDALVVAEGFSSIDQTSHNNTTPTNRMEFASLRHENRGTLRVSTTDTGTYGGTIPETQAHCIVRGFGEHAIGAGGAPGSNRESIVPWIVCPVQWGYRLYFPFAGERDGETDCLLRGLTHPASKDSLAAATDSGENVFVNEKTIALESDATVNSLCLNNNWSKGTALGAGRTLTIVSGGLVLEGDRAAIGREEEWKNGTAGTLVFPNEAYVYSTRQSLSAPNEIWAKIVAPKGLAISFPGYFRLGGDQTGIDGELVVNGCDVTLGSETAGCRIDVPVRLESGAATLRIGKVGSFCRRPLFLNDHAGIGPKFVACPGTVERVGLTYVNGVNLKKGLYGSSESGADIVDDNHFAGTGLVRICTDEGDKTTLLILR
ncbi:MAG: hypothetical protein II839_03525, partial [Kiritimatiellae bacterium]|nr:hypothetical protein [Kiritimatiellia bacterium]